jgi:opacity protein-like surface antigen
MKSILQYSLIFILIGCSTMAFAQYAAHGVKGGLTIGTQKWNGQDREALFSYNAGYVYENYTSNEKFSYLLELGYHVKGSAVRTNFYDLSGNLRQITTRNKFGQAGLLIGAKSVLDTKFAGAKVYYLIGARLEYTATDSIETIANLSNYINRVNYGITVGGGLEFKIADKALVCFEVQISPDFSQQIFMPPGNYIANYGGNTVFVQFQEQKVINTVVEIGAVLKLQRY